MRKSFVLIFAVFLGLVFSCDNNNNILEVPKKIRLVNLSLPGNDFGFELEDNNPNIWQMIAGTHSIELNGQTTKEFLLLQMKNDEDWDPASPVWTGMGSYWGRIWCYDSGTDSSLLYISPGKINISGEITQVDFSGFKQAGKLKITNCNSLVNKEIEVFLFTQNKAELLANLENLPIRYGYGFSQVIENDGGNFEYNNWLGLEENRYFWGIGNEPRNLSVGIATIEDVPEWYVSKNQKQITAGTTTMSFTADFEPVSPP